MLNPDQPSLFSVLENQRVAYLRLSRILRPLMAQKSSRLWNESSALLTNLAGALPMVEACNEIRFYLAAALLTQVRARTVDSKAIKLVEEIKGLPLSRTESGLSYVLLKDTVIVQVPTSFSREQRSLIARDIESIRQLAMDKENHVFDFSAALQPPPALWKSIELYNEGLGKNISLVWVGREAAELDLRNKIVQQFRLRYFAGHFFSKNIVESLPRCMPH